ncbi:MAG TPA: peroxiredoxin [Nannocystaceae bacterium]|nr:peroxiredoxin [Nannocystaceae bacterium]
MSNALFLPLAMSVLVACAKPTAPEPSNNPSDQASAETGAAPAKRKSLLAVGDEVPALTTAAHDGSTIDLRKLGRPTIVYFYPKDDTPGCTKEACAFRDAWDKFTAASVGVVGVSSDDDESHRAFAKKYEFVFPLIADRDHTWAHAFGVPMRLGMTARVSFLVGADGKIAKVYPDVDPAIHSDEVLKDAAAL